MVLPSRAALHWVTLWSLAAAALALAGVQTEWWLWSGVALFAVMAADAATLLVTAQPAAQRRVAATLAVGRYCEVGIRLSNRAAHSLRAEVRDHVPAPFQTRNQPLRLDLPARAWAESCYELRSLRRGAFRFEGIAVRLRTRLGLMERQIVAGAAQEVRVYPDFAAIAGYALLATDHRLSRMGILQRRRRGEGMEFRQLREYRRGDSPRRIDWKATARMHRLVARDYQDERDQSIVLLLDCGRRMATLDGELSHFDAALNAALLLAHVGLHHGDAVGLLTMAGSSRFVAPRKGSSTTPILNAVYDLQPTLHSPDYHAAALDLMRRVHRRALVVVLSNLRDEDDDTLLPALALLRRRHLVLFASLRERVLARTLSAPVQDLDAALTHAATADYLHWRQASFRRLEQAGAWLLDVEPQELPLALVNRYLDLKRSGTL